MNKLKELVTKIKLDQSITLFFLLLFASIFPIFSAYSLCFIVLLWLVSTKQIMTARNLFFAEKSTDVTPKQDFDKETKIAPRHNSAVYMHYLANARPMFRGIAFFIACIFLAATLSYFSESRDISYGAWIKPLSHITVKWLLLAVVVHLYLGLFKTTPGFWLRMNKLCFSFVLLVSIYCIAQLIWGIHWSHGFSERLAEGRFAYGVYRVSGFLDHPITFSYILALWILFLHGVDSHLTHDNAVTRKGFASARFLSLSSLIMCYLCLFLTNSRWTIVILLAISGCITLMQKGKKLSFFLILLAIVAVVLLFNPAVLGRFSELANWQNNERIAFWKAYWLAFQDAPWFGLGPKLGAAQMDPYYAAVGSYVKMYLAHNIFLQIAANYGILGLCGLLGFLSGLFKTLRKFTTDSSRLVKYGVYAFVILGGLTQNHLFDSEFLYCLWLVIAGLNYLQFQDKRSLLEHEEPLENYQSRKNWLHSG